MGVKRNLDTAGLSSNASNITEDEAQLYDRQIRLWGMDCQKRLRAAKILVIGLNGLGAEVVKNLTLSGVKSLTIIDEAKVKPSDLCAQFFLSGSEPGQNRAEASKSAIQELNPNVQIIIDNEPVSSKPTQFFAGFQAVFATDCLLSDLIKLNKACRENSVIFFCGDTWGFYGYCFLDLLKFTCTSVIKRDKEPEINRIEKLEFCSFGASLGAKIGAGLNRKVNNVFYLLHVMNQYREICRRYPLPESRAADTEGLRKTRSIVSKALGFDETKLTDDMLSNAFGELSPVCAAVGGVLANEIIKGITKQGVPLCNYFLFDGEGCVGAVERILMKD